ncbi:MAG TPA: hypothetical protein V6D06_04725 [Trichocoleus sp.]
MEIVLVLGALLVVLLVVGWIFKVVKSTLRTLLFVGFVLLALWTVFGIGPGALLEQIREWLAGMNQR